jgi:AraC-like DNA-binding protein
MDRLGTTPDWQARFEVLDDVLTRRARPAGPSTGPIGGAWNRMVETRGALRIGDLAREIGSSRRQLTTRFSREYGLTPKQASRIMRFERSWHVLRRVERRRRVSAGRDRATLAEVAIRCGYADQSHLDREWNALAGCPPSRWMADEELPFVQDDTGDDA